MINMDDVFKPSAVSIQLNEITGRAKADFCIRKNAKSGAPSEQANWHFLQTSLAFARP